MDDGADVPLFPNVRAQDAAQSRIDAMLRRVSPCEIPSSEDIFSASEAAKTLSPSQTRPLSVIAVGDIMLGGRAKELVALHGADYPFEAVLPVLRRAPIVIGNLEGPLAKHAKKQSRKFSYRVDPRLAFSLNRAGINVVTLANNHLLDCGRRGVLETLDALRAANVHAIGGGTSAATAHSPAVLEAHGLKIGILGYYWNRRTSATADLPGSAIDSFEALGNDIRSLRRRVDRVLVTFHWGIPYEREPSPDDRSKARFAVDCGADAVIGHHPHVIQPFEVYRGCPIFYSVGNFAFGSGNSRAEGLLVGFRFEKARTCVEVHPLYVKNRDPRVNYQPKLLAGAAADRVLSNLATMSGESAKFMTQCSAPAVMELVRNPSEGREDRHE